MKRASIVLVVVSFAIFATPPTARASGTYGAVVEKGVRGCTTDDELGIVICFAAPSVNQQSRSAFLQVWSAARSYFRWDRTDAAMLRVRSVSPAVGTPPVGAPAVTFVAHADLVLPALGCTDNFLFHTFNGNTQLESFANDCGPA